jgi:hypothetical protein
MSRCPLGKAAALEYPPRLQPSLPNLPNLGRLRDADQPSVLDVVEIAIDGHRVGGSASEEAAAVTERMLRSLLYLSVISKPSGSHFSRALTVGPLWGRFFLLLGSDKSGYSRVLQSAGTL